MTPEDHPIDFVWIKKNVIGAANYPSEASYAYFHKIGIKVIFNLTQSPIQSKTIEGFIYHHIYIPDFSTPTKEQVIEFLTLAQKYETQHFPIVVHCIGGCGRTGQLLAIWGIEHEMVTPDIATGKLDPVKWIKRIRPCAVETEAQKTFVRNWNSK